MARTEAQVWEETHRPGAASRGGLSGRQLGDFVVHERIGEGGFGVVYRAEQPALGRDAVIKVLHPHLAIPGTASERFLLEAQLASRLDHPYAAHIYAFGAEKDGTLWLAMERVRGIPLNELLQAGPLSLRELVPLLDSICEVVHTAHEQGIIHRDLKGANVMIISRAGRLLPKLLDFGIAKFVQSSATVEAIGAPVPRAMPLMLAPPPGGTASRDNTAASEAFVGSPAYCAPEQWVNPALADARTDVYALGVLAYVSLKGSLPFTGRNLSQIARAHAKHPMPSLGSGFPPALDAVLAKACAKLPRNRYSSTLELARALRTAAGLGEDSKSFPRLPTLLLKELQSEAPRPLAEATARLEAAGAPREAAEALRVLVSTLCRYLGGLSLACQARSGPLRVSRLEGAEEMLRELWDEGLADARWVELARLLTAPELGAVDAHPLPALVRFICEAPGGTGGVQMLAGLAAHVNTPLPDGEGEEARQQAHLKRSVEELEAVLRRLAPVFEYELVAARNDTSAEGGEAERWMGVRRAHLPSVHLRGRALRALEPALLNAAGAPVLSLFPFFQVAEPSPSAPEELFLFERSGRFGARLRALPTDLERQDDLLASEYQRLFLAGSATAVASEDHDHAPYRGLAAFGVGDAGSFFGREREAESFWNRMRQTPMLVVVGASGAGKSSFVQAGVVPLLPPEWRTLVVRPGRNPIGSLVSRLSEEGFRTPGLAFALADSPEALRKRLEEELQTRGPGSKLLLVVDQFEETLTLCASAEERRAYVLALGAAANSPLSPIRVVMTLRDDFLMRVQHLPGMKERMVTGLQLLATPSPEDLVRIVTEPARRLGYHFEPADLPERMVQAVAEQPGALALLSFTALKLWELRDRQFRQLSGRAYEALGGVGGALAQHAEAMLTRMTEPVKLLVREAFRQLVTAEGTRAVLTRPELRQVLGDGPDADGTIEQLIQARLLVSQDGPAEGLDTVEVTHEALLSAWPRLVKWRNEDAEGIRLRDELRAAARVWEARGQPKALLWRGELLTEFRIWRNRYPGHLTSSEESFIRRSQGADRLRRRLSQVLVAAAFAVLAVGLGVALHLSARAESRWLALLEEQGRQATLAENPLRALAFLSEAYRHGARDPQLEFLLHRNRGALDGVERVFRGHAKQIYSADISADGLLAVSGGEDGEALVWDRARGEVKGRVGQDSGPISFVLFPADARTVLVLHKTSAVPELWDVASGKRLHRFEGHTERLTSAALTPDRRVLATSGLDAKIRLWDVAGQKLLRVLEGHEGTVNALSFSADGRRLISGSDDKTARVWNLEDGRLLATLSGHRDVVWVASLSGDGKLAATGSNDHTAKVWDVDTAKVRFSYTGHSRNLSSAQLSRDGKSLLTTSEDGGARILSTDSGEVKVTLTGDAPLWYGAFAPDQRSFVTTGADARLRSYDTASGTLSWVYTGHTDAIGFFKFFPDGRSFLSASFDGTARIWNAGFRESRASVSSGGAPFTMGAFSHDGQRAYFATRHRIFTLEVGSGRPGPELPLADKGEGTAFVAVSPDDQVLAVGAGSVVELRRSSDFSLLKTLRGHSAGVNDAVFSPDGKLLLTSSLDRTARLWELESGRTLSELPHQGQVWYSSFSPDGKRVVTASQDQKARIWNVRSGGLLHTLQGHVRAVNAARFSPDGSRIITASDDRTAKIWLAETGAVLATLDEHTAEMYDAAFSPDGALVYTSGNDTRVMAWEAGSGKLLGPVAWHRTGIPSVRASGQLLLSASEDAVGALWNVRGGGLDSGQVVAESHCYVPFVFQGDHLLHTPVDRAGCPDLP